MFLWRSLGRLTKTKTAGPSQMPPLGDWVQQKNGISGKLSGLPLTQVSPWGTTLSGHTVSNWLPVPLWSKKMWWWREGDVSVSAAAVGVWGRHVHVPFNTDRKG